jgi:hypothetical protein
MESRPFLTRVPDQSIIVGEAGKGADHQQSTRDANGSFVMVYVPAGRAFKVRMSKVNGPQVKAWWFNPRTGQAQLIGEFRNEGEREFTPPAPGEELDWVLVLDEAAKAFPAPGR